MLKLRGNLRFNEILAPYTSWHMGGPAARYYAPKDLEDLVVFLKSLEQNEPLTWLGLGSNVLISDRGLKGTVIHTLGMESSLPTLLPSGLVRAEVNIPSAKLAKFCSKNGLLGGEFFAGIPGTIGGALVMNAGAFGDETWAKVESVEVIDRQGNRSFRSPEEYEIRYRSVRLKDPKEEWFIAGHFRFETGDSSESLVRIKELLRKRNETQPIGVFSCGSVFKNPPGDHAARLIDSCQLKGYAVDGAHISPKHANFIINTGTAKAADAMQIIQHIMKTVYEKHHIKLEPEVRMLGFESDEIPK